MPGIDFGLDRFGRRDPDPLMTVTQLTAAVKSAITSMPELSHVAVAGEISSCTRSAKGHIYITLKDGASVVSAVVFAGSARTLTHQPQVNEQVVCYGSVDVYGGQGRYQLYCTDITLQGAGTQAAELEALRRRLEQEGLFSQHRPIPAMPRIIAVVTSAGGAALTDIKNVLARRCPMVKLLLIPALVQGAERDVTGMVLAPSFKSALAAQTTTDGAKLYPQLAWGANPGEVNGLRVESASNLSAGSSLDRALVGDFTNCFKWGYAKEMPIEVIQYGNPDNDADLGDLKGHNQVYLRGEAYIGWGILDPSAFAHIKANA